MSSSTTRKPSSSSSTSKPPSKSKSSSTTTPHKLTLPTSSPTTITEFFSFSLHTILFQRGVYPPEDFSPIKKYGLNMLVSTDDAVKSYIKKIMKQLGRWMERGKISRLVVVISEKEGGDVERWEFGVDPLGAGSGGRSAKTKAKADERSAEASKTESAQPPASQENSHPTTTSTAPDPTPPEPKTDNEIQSEIRALFRQITASVTFLPTLSAPCTFNVLVYADADSEVPLEWGDSDAKEIEGAEKVKLRGFSTESHRVETVVSYRVVE